MSASASLVSAAAISSHRNFPTAICCQSISDRRIRLTDASLLLRPPSRASIALSNKIFPGRLAAASRLLRKFSGLAFQPLLGLRAPNYPASYIGSQGFSVTCLAQGTSRENSEPQKGEKNFSPHRRVAELLGGVVQGQPTKGGTGKVQPRSKTLDGRYPVAERLGNQAMALETSRGGGGAPGSFPGPSRGKGRQRKGGEGEGESRKLGSRNASGSTALHMSSNYVQILGTGMDTADTSPSVLLFMDSCRLMFNAGEGLQRFCIEHKIRLARIDKVLLTRISTETTGGLPGLLLTMANIGESGLSVDVYGPSDLHHLADAMKCFTGSAKVRTFSFGRDAMGGSPNTSAAGERRQQDHPVGTASKRGTDRDRNSAVPRSFLEAAAEDRGTSREAATGGEGGGAGELSSYLVHSDQAATIRAVVLRPSDPSSPAAAPPPAAAPAAAAGSPPASSAAVARLVESAPSGLEGGIGKEGKNTARVGLLEGQQGEEEDEEDLFSSLKRSLVKDMPEEPRGVKRRKDEGAGSSVQEAWKTRGGARRILAAPSRGPSPSVVYLCEQADIPGKFDPERARERGLRPGYKYGQLQRGMSVESDDGTSTIHPSDVMEPSVPGPIFLIVDCPSASHIGPLCSAQDLQRFRISSRKREEKEHKELESKQDKNEAERQEGAQATASDSTTDAPNRGVTCVVHLTPHSVAQLPEYQEWMESLGPSTNHIMAGHGSQPFGAPPVLPASLRVVAKLHNVCPSLFPLHALTHHEDLRLERKARRKEAWMEEQEAKEQKEKEAQGGLDRADGGMVEEQAAETAQKLRCISAEDGISTDVVEEETRPSSLAKVIVAQNLMKFHFRPLSLAGLDLQSVPPPFNFNPRRSSPRSRSSSPTYSPPAQQGGEEDKAGGRKEPALMPLKNQMEGEQEVQEDEDPWLSELVSMSAQAKQAQQQEQEGVQNLEVEGVTVGLEERERQGPRRDNLEVVFLGTGSSQPSKYRNVSAILLNLFERGAVLLDCGEGTYAQMRRRYGNEGADDVVSSLRLIWISHIHADHHAGLARVLAARKGVLAERQQGVVDSGAGVPPLLVVGPKPLKRFLDAYEPLEDLCFRFLDCSQTTEEAEALAYEAAAAGSPVSSLGTDVVAEAFGTDPITGKSLVVRAGGKAVSSGKQSPPKLGGLLSPRNRVANGPKGGLRPYWTQPGYHIRAGLDVEGRAALAEALRSAGLGTLKSVPVVHCAHAFGVAVGSADWEEVEGQREEAEQKGWKVVYSGDTRPCESLVEASRGATLLIHEATFDDSLRSEAVSKRHSCTSEAVNTGVKAGVQHIILTHFSQRYPKIPVICGNYTERTGIAFDMMSVNLEDLGLLPKVLPQFRMLFEEERIEEEEGEAVQKAVATAL